jgi:hypothetical protein
MLSKTKLFLALAEVAPDRWPTAPKSMQNETYGRKSMIYVSCGTPERRKQIEAALTAKGFKVNTGYWSGSATTEVQVSYFKGWHHNE